jgi:hypothetical protein
LRSEASIIAAERKYEWLQNRLLPLKLAGKRYREATEKCT